MSRRARIRLLARGGGDWVAGRTQPPWSRTTRGSRESRPSGLRRAAHSGPAPIFLLHGPRPANPRPRWQIGDRSHCLRSLSSSSAVFLVPTWVRWRWRRWWRPRPQSLVAETARAEVGATTLRPPDLPSRGRAPESGTRPAHLNGGGAVLRQIRKVS